MKTISKIPLVAVMMLVATMGVASAQDAPAMWMVQTDSGDINLMVNTNETSSGANAHIYFDPDCINITGMDFNGSPWQPMVEPGWSHQYNHTRIALTNFDGVEPGEYQIAAMTVDIVDENATETEVTIINAEPKGVIVYNLTYNCTEEPEPPVPDEDAVIGIGDGTGAVTLPITITGADNVGSVDVTLNFDPTVVNVTGIETGDFDCTYTNTENIADGWVRVGAIQGNSPGIDDNATILYVTFEPVVQNATCDLIVTVTTYKDDTPTGEAMNYTIVSGVYTASLNGDVNGDGVVDVADAHYLGNHIVGNEGYEALDDVAADVDGSGDVDMADVAYLMNYIIGESEYEELL